MDDVLIQRAADLMAICRETGLRLATAESCTGGLVAACLTEIPGSSDVFERGFVTYSNAAKMDLLGVSAQLLKTHGAVSEAVARAMAQGALEKSDADIAAAITGIAGPGGGTAEKPVGLVHIACARENGQTIHQRCLFADEGRRRIRQMAAETALRQMLDACRTPMIA